MTRGAFIRTGRFIFVGSLVLILVLPTAARAGIAQNREPPFPAIPRTWDDDAMAELEIPLTNPSGSPKYVSADYYYRIPVRPIYKSYPVYAPGHEPPNYIEG